MWIDCDAGVDDAQGLLLALADPTVQIVGISCVAGNVGVDKVLLNVARILTLCGRCDIPFYRGAAAPLLCPPKDASWWHGQDGMGDAPLAVPVQADVVCQPAPGVASVKLLEAAAAHDGQLTVVALGPLTNLAIACHLDPAFPSRVARLVAMGSAERQGNVTPCAEFNFEHDAEAASLVLKAFPRTTLVSWECCLRHPLPWSVVDSWAAQGTPKAAFLAAILHLSNKRARSQLDKQWLTADPLAMAVALQPALALTCVDVFVDVELHGSLTRGMSVYDWKGHRKEAPNVELVKQLDVPAFTQMLAHSLR